METSARLFHCARCGRPARICSRCDRGNRYCGSECARAARADSVRAAGKRYQGGRRGRRHHAERQRRWRRRRAKKVTHQGSHPSPTSDLLSPQSREHPDGGASAPETRGDSPVCEFCGRPCSDLLRLDFLRTPRRAARSRQARAPLWSVPRRGDP